VTGIALSLFVLAAVAVSAALFASIARVSTSGAILLAYLVVWAQLVVWPLILSPFDALTRSGIVAASLASLGVALTAWLVAGRPLPSGLSGSGRAAELLRDPVIAIPAVTVVLVYTYLAAIGLATSQNDHDPLVYHLTRAALWRQQQSVGIVGDGVELRIDGNPIVGELGDVVWLTLAEGERFVWLGQFMATFALALAVYGLARRVGIERREALLSGLLVPMLAVVAMQAVTAYNDVVFASFLVCSAVFALGRGRAEWLALVLAVALAVGTKFTGLLLIPLIGLIVAVAHPPRRWLGPTSALVLGTVAGSGWYVVNLARTGDLTGGIADAGNQTPELTPTAVIVRIQQLALDAFDVSGSLGTWRFAYLAAGVAVALWGFRARRSRVGISAAQFAAIGVGIVMLPIAVTTARVGLRSGVERMWNAVGDEAAAASATSAPISFVADGSDSWFGPLFVPLAIAALAAAIIGLRRRALPPVTVVLAAAPFLAILVFALTIVYDPWRGRFLIAPAAMSVATWGLITRTRWVALIAAVGASVTVVSCAAVWQLKPSGIGYTTFLHLGSADDRGEHTTIRFLEQQVPADAAIALRLRWNDFRFPSFGPDLGRTVHLIGPGEQLPTDAEWAVVAPRLAAVRCFEAWEVRHRGEHGWRVLRRVASDAVCRRS
jgi:hypothetical protein